MIHNCSSCNHLSVKSETEPCPHCGSFESFFMAMTWRIACALQIPVELLLQPYKVEDAEPTT